MGILLFDRFFAGLAVIGVVFCFAVVSGAILVAVVFIAGADCSCVLHAAINKQIKHALRILECIISIGCVKNY